MSQFHYKIEFQSQSDLIEGKTAPVTVTTINDDLAISYAITKTFGECRGKLRRFLRHCAVIVSKEPAQLEIPLG